MDSFELAITTYALHLVNSPDKDQAFKMLVSRQRSSRIILRTSKNLFYFSSGASGIYWSNIDLPSNRVAFVALNERLAPKYESELEAHAIASTSFALLTYILRAQTSLGQPIVHWLQTRRNYVAGWSSTYDSVFALKSLVHYAIRHGDTIREYNLRVNISSSDNVYRMIEPISIVDENIIDMQRRSIQNVYGRVFMDVYGVGYALVQVRERVNIEFKNELLIDR